VIRKSREAFEVSRSVKTRAALAPPAFIEAVAERAVELMAERIPAEPEPWIGVKEACAHLACSPDRIYRLNSARRIPSHKEGNRVLFRRSELDEWAAGWPGRLGEVHSCAERDGRLRRRLRLSRPVENAPICAG
jgi:excisionase family DNA binding protein